MWNSNWILISEVNGYIYINTFLANYHPAKWHGLKIGLSKRELVKGKTGGKGEGGLQSESLLPWLTGRGVWWYDIWLHGTFWWGLRSERHSWHYGYSCLCPTHLGLSVSVFKYFSSLLLGNTGSFSLLIILFLVQALPVPKAQYCRIDLMPMTSLPPCDLDE